MTKEEAMQWMLTALAGSASAIGWWIGSTLTALNDKMGRVLIHLETHEVRITRLETSPKGR